MSERTTTDIAISAKALRKSYPAPEGELEVLRGVDLDLAVGEIVAVTGLSGVGKSTLLNVLGLLDTPTSGALEYRLRDGRVVDSTTFGEPERARLRNEQIGFVFQFFHLLSDLDVRENVMLPAMITRSPWRFRRDKRALTARADALLERVGLSDRVLHRPRALSGGERQRVAVARALMNEPSVLLCDEPTGNLDTSTSDLIHELFVEINRETRTTVLLVTHDPTLADRAHRQLAMVDGQFLDPAAATVAATTAPRAE